MSNLELFNALKSCSNSANDRLINRYLTFIQKCQEVSVNGYTESHHILPRSMSGSNEPSNLIKLSARCHYIAHLLLAKATNHPKMIKALHKMTFSVAGDVQRSYKISSRNYEYLRKAHAKVVSDYSKNTVVVKELATNIVKRIEKSLFDQYKNVKYQAISKGVKHSVESNLRRSVAAKKPRTVKQGTRTRSLAATKFSYITPSGICENWVDVIRLYPSFRRSTIYAINKNKQINKKFISIHPEFEPYLHKTWEELGFKKVNKHG